MAMAMQLGVFVDAVQTTVLAVIAGALMLLLRNEMKAAAGGLNRVLSGQAETALALERLWLRIEALEKNQRPDL